LKKIARSFFIGYQNIEIAGSEACADDAVLRFSARNADRKILPAQQGRFEAAGGALNASSAISPSILMKRPRISPIAPFLRTKATLASGKADLFYLCARIQFF
jgi:hypothetical protein